jgi:hypothetical protein
MHIPSKSHLSFDCYLFNAIILHKPESTWIVCVKQEGFDAW